MVKTKLKDEEKKAIEKVGAEALAVYSKAGSFIREYSAKEHGENFVQLAEGFAKKIGGSVRKSG